ncbi:MAG: hypothetical protein WC965_01380 [Thiohalomonadaceae bacterium]
MDTGIEARLQAALNFGVIYGTETERSILERQIREAVKESMQSSTTTTTL